MRLYFSGIPGSESKVIELNPPGGTLGRRSPDSEPDIAIPEDNRSWSRRHARFDFDSETSNWKITLLSRVETKLNGISLLINESQNLETNNIIECCGVRISVSKNAITSHDSAKKSHVFETVAIDRPNREYSHISSFQKNLPTILNTEKLRPEIYVEYLSGLKSTGIDRNRDIRILARKLAESFKEFSDYMKFRSTRKFFFIISNVELLHIIDVQIRTQRDCYERISRFIKEAEHRNYIIRRQNAEEIRHEISCERILFQKKTSISREENLAWLSEFDNEVKIFFEHAHNLLSAAEDYNRIVEKLTYELSLSFEKFIRNAKYILKRRFSLRTVVPRLLEAVEAQQRYQENYCLQLEEVTRKSDAIWQLTFEDLHEKLERIQELYSRFEHQMQHNNPQRNRGLNNVATKAECRWEAVLDGDLRTFTGGMLTELLETMRRASNDQTLRIYRIEQGSIVLILEGSKEGFQIIKNLHENGKLAPLLGLPVKDVLLALDDNARKSLLPLESDTGRNAELSHLRSAQENKLIIQPKNQEREAAELRSKKQPLHIFYIYASKDEPYREQLELHLALLKIQQRIDDWDYRRITAGTEVEEWVERHLSQAEIIALLVSPDFFACKECFGNLLGQSMRQHEAKTSRVVPILLRPVYLRGAPFEHLQMLPKDRKPIAQWESYDAAWVQVVEGICEILDDLSERSSVPAG